MCLIMEYKIYHLMINKLFDLTYNDEFDKIIKERQKLIMTKISRFESQYSGFAYYNKMKQLVEK